MLKKKYNIYLIIFIVLFLLIPFFSCSQKTGAASFIGALDYADSLAKQNQHKDALNVLLATEKKALTVQQQLSVIKRYLQLSENTHAEKLLQAALKKNPTNIELRAVYSHFLIDKKRFSQAAEIAAPLEGTKYGSIYTQAKIRSTVDRTDFLSASFVQNYIDAAKITSDSAFLRNAALILAKTGHIEKAANLHPEKLFYYEYPLFWALLSYDAQKYMQAFADIALIDESAETLSLKADIFTRNEEYKNAHTLWQAIIKNYPDFSPLAFANAALWAAQNQETVLQADLLTALVSQFPTYIPGLVLYSQLALELAKPQQDDLLTTAVKKAGLQSLHMKTQSLRPRIPIEDAKYRIRYALQQTQDKQLAVELLKLNWQSQSKTVKEKTVDLWIALEQAPENDYFKEYAIWYFLFIENEAEAKKLFDDYIQKKYGSTDFFALFPQLNLWESEYAAYFILKQIPNKQYENYELPIALYEKILSQKPNDFSLLLNQANILNSNGKQKEALKLYAHVAETAKTSKEKAYAHVRSAQIYLALGDVRNAQISLDYAESLDPQNMQVRILQKKY